MILRVSVGLERLLMVTVTDVFTACAEVIKAIKDDE